MDPQCSVSWALRGLSYSGNACLGCGQVESQVPGEGRVGSPVWVGDGPLSFAL